MRLRESGGENSAPLRRRRRDAATVNEGVSNDTARYHAFSRSSGRMLFLPSTAWGLASARRARSWRSSISA